LKNFFETFFLNSRDYVTLFFIFKRENNILKKNDLLYIGSSDLEIMLPTTSQIEPL